MLTVTLTNRAVLNNATGLDITVPTVRETEAPLGYSSIEYNIHVISKLPCFKTTKLKDTDVIEFVVSKTYREVQDLYEKLKRKYRNVPFPAFISGAQTGDENIQERQKTLEMLMAFISQSLELSTSSIFLQFLGVDPKNPQSIHVNIDSPLSDVKQSSDDECEDHNENEEPDGIFKKVKLKKEKPSETEQSQPLAEVQKPEKDLKDSSIKPSERFESLFDDTSKKPEPEDDDEYEDLFVAATKSKESSRIRNTFESGTPPKAKVSLFGEQDYGDKLSKEEAKLFTVPQCDPDEDFLFNSPRRNPAKKQVNDAVEVDLTDKNLDGILEDEDDIFALASNLHTKRSTNLQGNATSSSSPNENSSTDHEKDTNANDASTSETSSPQLKPVPKPRTKLPPQPSIKAISSAEPSCSPESSPIRKGLPTLPTSKPAPPPKPRALSSTGRPTPLPKPAFRTAALHGAQKLADQKELANRRQDGLHRTTNQSNIHQVPAKVATSEPSSDDLDILKYIEDHQNSNKSDDIKLFD